MASYNYDYKTGTLTLLSPDNDNKNNKSSSGNKYSYDCKTGTLTLLNEEKTTISLPYDIDNRLSFIDTGVSYIDNYESRKPENLFSCPNCAAAIEDRTCKYCGTLLW